MTEADFQQQVLDLAAMYRWRAYHTHDSRRSHAGFPDLVLVRAPRLIFAELKTAAGRLTAAQAGWLEELRDVADAGRFSRADRGAVEVYLWRPADLQAIAGILGPRAVSPLAAHGGAR